MRNEKINRRGKGSGSRGAAPFIGLRVLTQDHQPARCLAFALLPAALLFSFFFFFLSTFSLFVFFNLSVCVFTHPLFQPTIISNLSPFITVHLQQIECSCHIIFLLSGLSCVVCCLFLFLVAVILSVLQPWRYIYELRFSLRPR